MTPRKNLRMHFGNLQLVRACFIRQTSQTSTVNTVWVAPRVDQLTADDAEVVGHLVRRTVMMVPVLHGQFMAWLPRLGSTAHRCVQVHLLDP